MFLDGFYVVGYETGDGLDLVCLSTSDAGEGKLVCWLGYKSADKYIMYEDAEAAMRKAQKTCSRELAVYAIEVNANAMVDFPGGRR